MSLADDIKMYWRFSTALHGFLNQSMTLEDARNRVSQRLLDREQTFLKTAEKSIYGHPSSPYRALLLHAGCELGDLHSLVQKHQLEGALRMLREAGVYVGFEEFKGRVPIQRPGLELPVSASDFDNPFLVRHFVTESGGSTGVRTRLPQDLDRCASLSPLTRLSRDAYGVEDAPLAVWRSILPSGSGINNVLYPAYYGKPPEKWFSQLKPFEARGLKYTIATYYFCALAKICGSAIPFPEHVPVDRAIEVARWAAEAVKCRGKSVVSGTVSSALRASIAAQEHGIDLSGVYFLTGGEPMTPEKARGIEASGARFIQQYAMSETGRIGNGCPEALDPTDVHLATDSYAIIPYPRPLDGFDIDVDAFHLTTLLPSAPKLMLNVETDDYGIIEERDCGCPWARLGFRTHLRGIRSYRKLTGEGMTLIGSDIVQVLEHDLPAKFGGSALDYQLLEQEDERGLTRVYLVISPRVPVVDEKEVAEFLMSALGEMSAGADFARAIWAQAGSIQIKRMEPVLSGHGKHNPLQVVHREPR